MHNLIKLPLMPLLLGLLLQAQGCSTSIQATQTNQPTVAELYQQGQQNSSEQKYKALGVNSLYVRNSQNELENRFPLLPNPTLNMFIYPHLVNNSHPVPGYTTNFNLYKVNQYALPSDNY